MLLPLRMSSFLSGGVDECRSVTVAFRNFLCSILTKAAGKKTFALLLKSYLCASNFHCPLQIIIVILLTAVCVQLLYLCLFIIAFIRGRSVDAAVPACLRNRGTAGT